MGVTGTNNVEAGRLFPDATLNGLKVKKVEEDNNCVFDADIKGTCGSEQYAKGILNDAYTPSMNNKTLERTFMERVLHTARTGYAMLKGDKKGALTPEQENFLLQNQITKEQVTQEDGTKVFVYQNQGAAGDKKITKSEMFNAVELRKSLKNVAPEKLSEDEKTYIAGFDKCMAPEGTTGTTPFVSDAQAMNSVGYVKAEHIKVGEKLSLTIDDRNAKNVQSYLKAVPSQMKQFLTDKAVEDQAKCKKAMETSIWDSGKVYYGGDTERTN